MMDAKTLATEAERLLKDPVLLKAIASMRLEALEAMTLLDPFEVPNTVARHQATVLACDGLLSALKRHILALPRDD